MRGVVLRVRGGTAPGSINKLPAPRQPLCHYQRTSVQPKVQGTAWLALDLPVLPMALIPLHHPTLKATKGQGLLVHPIICRYVEQCITRARWFLIAVGSGVASHHLSTQATQGTESVGPEGATGERHIYRG